MGSVKGFKARPVGLTTGRPLDGLQRSIDRLQHSFQQDGPPYEVLLVASHEHSFFGAVPPDCQGNREWTVVYSILSIDPVVSEDRISKLESGFVHG